MFRSYWELRKALGTLGAIFESHSPPPLCVKKTTEEWSVNVNSLSVVQCWRRIKGRRFVSEKVVFHIVTLSLRLTKYFI